MSTSAVGPLDLDKCKPKKSFISNMSLDETVNLGRLIYQVYWHQQEKYDIGNLKLGEIKKAYLVKGES